MKPLDKEAVRAANRLEDVIPALLGVPLNSRNGSEPAVCCPFHEDSTPSLRISLSKQQWFCDPCGFGGDVFEFVQRHQGIQFPAALQLLAERGHVSERVPLKPSGRRRDNKPPLGPIVKAYDYTDEQGVLLYQVVRYEQPKKDFRARQPDGKGGWIPNIQGVRRVPYRLHKLRGRQYAIIVEGEKDVDRLCGLGWSATTNVFGASKGKGKWTADDTQQIVAAGVARVLIIPDNDEPGRVHAENVAQSCLSAGLIVKMLELPDVPSDGGDVSDYLDTHSADELKALLETAPEYRPGSLAPPDPPQADPADVPSDRAKDNREEVDPACEVCGRESCEDHLPAEPATQVPAQRLIFLSAAETIAEPNPIEIVEGVLWAGCVTVLVSESGAGKTFVLLNLAAHLSACLAWHGRCVEACSVAYLSFEGDALGHRLQALRDVAGHRLEHVYTRRVSDPLSPRVSHDGEKPSLGEFKALELLTELSARLAADGKPAIGMIVIDTARASMTGSEDSSEHVSAYLRAVRRLLVAVPGAGVILAHHAGWQDGETQRKRERGSSAWRGNCDATLYLETGEYSAENGEKPLILRTLKVRDAERPAPLRLILRRVALDKQDRRGRPVTSCIIERDRRSKEDVEAERARAEEAIGQATDLQVLKVMHTNPNATSNSKLRPYTGLRSDAVGASVSRIIREGLALAGTRGKPYTLTAKGLALLESQSAGTIPTIPNDTQRYPGTVQ